MSSYSSETNPRLSHSTIVLDIVKENSPPPGESSSTHQPEALVVLTLADQTDLLPFDKILVVLLSLGLCIVVSALDSVIVATALPTISKEFSAGAVVSWVPAAYLLMSTSFQPLYGRLSDIFGRKAALSVSMIVLIIGNAIAGFSRSIVLLIVARGISGAGGGGTISMCQIVVADIVTLRKRGKYQGIVGVMVAFGYAIGPVMGGALSESLSWRWCFWITIPVSFIATCIILFALPLKPVQGGVREKLLVIDYFGSFLSLIGSTLILLPLIWGGVTFSWISPQVLITLCCGLISVAVFCFWESRVARLPVIPMHIFKNLTVTGVYITMFANGFVFFSSIFYIPQYLEVTFSNAPIRAALYLIPYLVGQMAASWVSVRVWLPLRAVIYLVFAAWRAHSSVRLENIGGFAVWSVACGLISTITAASSEGVLVVYMLFAGIGAGQTLQTTTVAAQASVPRKDVAVVTSFRNFIRLLGGAFALGIGSTIINNTLHDSMTHLNLSPAIISALIEKPLLLASPASIGLSQEDATYILSYGYTRGFRTVFILNASWTAAATVAAFLLIHQVDLTDDDGIGGSGGEKQEC